MAIPPKSCVECNRVFVPRSWNPYMIPICSPECKQKRRDARRIVIESSCVICHTHVTLTGKKLWQAKTGKVYCSLDCSNRAKALVAGPLLAEYNRTHAPARMRANNPMHRAESREKMRQTLTEMRHGPTSRGGNGREPPQAQSLLWEALNALYHGWEMEFIQKTGELKKQFRLPNHLKIDIANASLRIAIEIDGPSHYSLARKDQDARKEAFLKSIGWRVLRFSNESVTSSLELCVQTVTSTISK